MSMGTDTGRPRGPRMSSMADHAGKGRAAEHPSRAAQAARGGKVELARTRRMPSDAVASEWLKRLEKLDG